MVIGSNNVFEVGCIIHAKSVGDNNVFESKCKLMNDKEVYKFKNRMKLL